MKPTDSTPAELGGSSPQTSAERVLFVNLEGGLLAADFDWEAIIEAVKLDPWAATGIPAWAISGHTTLSDMVWQNLVANLDTIPLRREVVDLAQERRGSGWRVVLVASQNETLARFAAAEAGVFDDVIMFSGADRLQALKAYCQKHELSDFAYLGGSREDLSIWSSSSHTTLVAPTAELEGRVRALGRPVHVLDPQQRRHRGRALLRAMRPQHWVKNLLVFAPVVFHHAFDETLPWLKSGLAFVLFCFACSSIYILNDLLDLPSDRRHPSKRKRPFASGALNVREGLATALTMLLVTGAVSMMTLPWEFSTVLAGYVALNVLYTTWLKRKVMIDILVLAGFYCLRIVAGGAATDIMVSEWLIALSMFLFLSLAFLKRHGELVRLRGEGIARTDNRGYRVQDLEMIETLGATSGYMAVMVLALYINGSDVGRLYSHPRVLWLVCPALLYWISRVWIWARRGVLAEDPLMFALKDRVSWITLVVIVLLAVIAL